MDKFGIFNLLNSFLSANSTPTENSDRTDGVKNDTIGSVLSAIKNNLNANNSPQGNTAPPQQKPPVQNKPLQHSMLSTMSSHDQFIKRVKEKSKT